MRTGHPVISTEFLLKFILKPPKSFWQICNSWGAIALYIKTIETRRNVIGFEKLELRTSLLIFAISLPREFF